jgi:hypothetical protein
MVQRLPRERSPRRSRSATNRIFTGVHAAAFSALIPASRRRSVGLGGCAEIDGSFPLTDGEHLPTDWTLIAALTSRSWMLPHPLHVQLLTTRLSRPARPVREPARGSKERSGGLVTGLVRVVPDLVDFGRGSIEPGIALALYFKAQGANARESASHRKTLADLPSGGKPNI